MIDLIIGVRFLLNVLHVLQTSKYSKAATFLYAIIFLSLAIVGLYALFISKKLNLSLWISIAPWAIIITLLFLNLILGDTK